MFTSRVLKSWASVAVVVTLATLYTRHHLAKFERKEWGQELYIEDSKAGATQTAADRAHGSARRRPSAPNLPNHPTAAAGNGCRYRVLQRAADAGGESFTVEILVRAGAPGYYTDYAGSPPEHVHDAQEETFVVRVRAGGWGAGGLGLGLGAGVVPPALQCDAMRCTARPLGGPDAALTPRPPTRRACAGQERQDGLQGAALPGLAGGLLGAASLAWHWGLPAWRRAPLHAPAAARVPLLPPGRSSGPASQPAAAPHRPPALPYPPPQLGAAAAPLEEGGSVTVPRGERASGGGRRGSAGVSGAQGAWQA
jgi:hypothetical protein